MQENTKTLTRRTTLKTIGGAVASAGVLSGVGAAADGSEPAWNGVETPTDRTLYDVETTAAGVYAVGGGGQILERTATGWRTVLDGGPTGNGNTLFGAGVTDDGERLWVVGSSGAIGEYDVRTGSLTDRSAPNDVTNNFNDVSVEGTADEANVYVAGDSGKIYDSFENGATGTWNQTTPGSGSAINAVDTFDARSGHAVDGNKTVFRTGDGSTYDKIGLADANVNFYGVDSDGVGDVTVVGGGGMVHDREGTRWIPTDLGDASLRDVEVEAGDGYTVGGGGVVFRRVDGEWTREATPTGANLKAVVRGTTPVAVGASGTVIERR
jgi:hypothetical protein